MGLEFQITDNSGVFKAAKEEAVRRAMEAIGLHLEGEAKDELENDPRRVDTGLLRNSITHALDGERPAISSYHADYGDGSGSYDGTAPKETGGGAVYVGTNVEYAIYVHFGTRKMEANAFLKNAFERNMDQVREYIIRELKG